MSDYNDFFDELIDDEAETDTQYFDGEDDDAEDDDEPAEVRTAVMAKGDMLALLSLKTTDSGGQIVRYDPRETLPSARRYDDGAEALRWFRRSLSTSLKNGWHVVYDGEPMFG